MELPKQAGDEYASGPMGKTIQYCGGVPAFFCSPSATGSLLVTDRRFRVGRRSCRIFRSCWGLTLRADGRWKTFATRMCSCGMRTTEGDLMKTQNTQNRLIAATQQVESGAKFSECRRYRYALWRKWDTELHGELVTFIGLNPSMADETFDDQTISRCIRFAKDWGYGGLLMLNVFGFRATDPKIMQAAKDPIGPGNDTAFRSYLPQAGMIVAAWGVHCPPDRERQLCEAIGREIYCLGRTKDGRPKHPLYVKANTKPELFWNRPDKHQDKTACEP